MIVAIEGIDGAGKGTLGRALEARAEAAGLRVARLSFPRYEETRFAVLIGQYLNGRLGGLDDVSPRFAALLYAGDRMESRDLLLRLGARNDLVILDRYVASNLAYNAAKLAPGERDGFVDWLAEVEFEIFELPRPDLTCLLATPPEIADSLVAQKPARSYTEMTRDLHEADRGYMARVAEVYERLAREERDSPWFRCASVKAEGGLRPPGEIADEVWHRLAPLLEGS